MEPDEEEWQFGDAWKQGSPDGPGPDSDVEFVEILRGDTGGGYDDTLLVELIGFLGSRGIRATYDSFAIGMEPAAIKTYVLKVEAGSEAAAREALSREFER